MTKPTPAEQTEIQHMLAALHAEGYYNLEQYTNPSTGMRLSVGSRVRHVGEQYPEAITRGTGVVMGLTHKSDSGWSRSWGKPDIELLLLRDESRFGSRLSQVAHYHVEVIPQAA